MENKAETKKENCIDCKYLQCVDGGLLGSIVVCGCEESPFCGEPLWMGRRSGCDKYKPRNEEKGTDNMIEHPDHYCAGRKYEPVKVIRDWGCGFFDGNAIKYIARAGRKPGSSRKEDLKKAIQYLKLEIEAIENEES